ncbi:MAG TPA: helix-turn-helix domain-containing protein [Candidatus Omnitrophota bacterium]|nr:helix-turn-helix domain-containing protein [Candidatus Omnitrophota bacterium]
MPEKLMTIRDVAEYLQISEDEVKRLVDDGEIMAYKIGGTFLRFRKEQIDAVKAEIDEFESKEPDHSREVHDPKARRIHTYSKLENEIKRKEPSVRQYDYTFFERIRDFFYFHDFYIISFIIIGALIYFIFK